MHRVTQAVKIPVIASLNGGNRESWLKFASIIEQAGAAALEVNWYQVNTDPHASGAAIEDELTEMIQPDLDIRTTKVVPRIELSTSAELPLRLRWIAILCGRVRASLAVTGGVATPYDGIKAVLAGADAVQMVSAWLDWHNMGSLAEARGLLSHKTTQDPGAWERANYIRTLQSWGSSH